MSPQLLDLLFAASALGLVALSLAVVLAKNPVRSTLLLILSFLPTAFLYLMLQAPFVAILQILVYGGAIMMLFTFVIMMINPAPRSGEIPDSAAKISVVPGGVFRVALRAALFAASALLVIPPVYQAAAGIATPSAVKPGFGSLASISELLFRDPANNPFTISFELMGFLILVGIIAAINFNRRRETAPQPPLRGRQPEGGA